jgi:hypothetical protein
MEGLPTYEEVKEGYKLVDKEVFYEFIGPKNVQLSVYFLKTDEVYCMTNFSLKYPRNIIGVEVSLQKMRDGKHIKEYYIKKGY